MPLQEIWQRIDSRYGGFSPQIQRAASFVRRNPQDVALLSLRSLARRAGVSPTSITRLMQALGYDSWEAFQAEHRDWLTAGRNGVFSGPADRLITDARTPGVEDTLLDVMMQAEHANIASAMAPSGRAGLRMAADLISGAPSVAVAGIRSCFAVAFSLCYALSLFQSNVRLMKGAGLTLLDELPHLRENDVLVVVSVAPYSREIVDLARHARGANVRVVGITDRPFNPLARLCDIALIAQNDSPAHIPSPIGPLAVTQALAGLVLARAGDAALEALRRRETLFETSSAYISAEAMS